MAKRPFAPKYETYDTSNGFGSREEWKQKFRERMSAEEAVRIVSDESPYKILGISRDATQDQIKAAYRKLIQEWHPDRNKSAEAEVMSKKINAAYTVLKNNQSKKKIKHEDFNNQWV